MNKISFAQRVQDKEKLNRLLDKLIKKNLCDVDIIKVLTLKYQSPSLFSVISYAEKYIYG